MKGICIDEKRMQTQTPVQSNILEIDQKRRSKCLITNRNIILIRLLIGHIEGCLGKFRMLLLLMLLLGGSNRRDPIANELLKNKMEISKCVEVSAMFVQVF